VNTTQIDGFLRKTLVEDPPFRAGVALTIEYVLYHNKLNRNNISATFNILPEHLFTIPIVFYFQKGFYLIEAMNERIHFLNAGGIIQHWIAQYFDMSYQKLVNLKGGPKVLDLYELSGAFEFWLLGIIVSTVRFAYEIVRFFYAKPQR